MSVTWDIGQRGEELAVEWLRSKGYLICERNWRSGRYEIDIIAEKWDTLHFVEVKTRKAGGWTTPEQAIDERKFSALLKAARAYFSVKRVRLEPQFDLIAIDLFEDGSHELRFIEHAMQCHW